MQELDLSFNRFGYANGAEEGVLAIAKAVAQQRATGRRDVGMPEKQKERERKQASKGPSFN